MDRVFEANASASPPQAPANPSNGYPTEGDPVAGQPATLPGAWWFHQVTEELRNAITGAGLTPDHTQLTQLLDSINALISQYAVPLTDKGAPNGVASLDASGLLNGAQLGPSQIGAAGYKVIPDQNSPSGKWIIQWDKPYFYAGNNGPFPFPLTFPNAVLAIFGNDSISGVGYTSAYVAMNAISTSQYQGYMSAGESGVHMLAIGY